MTINAIPTNREEAKALIDDLRSKFDIEDESDTLRHLIDVMEERHGEEFNAFFDAVILRVLLATDLPMISLDTNNMLQALSGRGSTGEYVEVKEVPGALEYHLRRDSTNS